VSRRVSTYVRIGGIETRVLTVRTLHDVDRPVSTGSLTMTAPLPPHVKIAAPVTVHAGYDGGALQIFAGRVADLDASFGDDGKTARIELEGWGKLAWYEHYQNVGYQGPMVLQRIFNGLCFWRGLLFYFADTTTAPDGTTIELGSNPDYKGGRIEIPADTSAGELLDRWARHFGYRTFDTPFLGYRLQRVSGVPPGTLETMPLYQHSNMLSVSQAQTIDGLTNYIETKGPKYKAPDTSEMAIRSFPAVVPSDSRLGNVGVAKKTISDDVFVTEVLARASRNAHEIDDSTDTKTWTWTTTGQPERTPGESVAILSPVVNPPASLAPADVQASETPVPLWLMSVRHTISEAGWTTEMTGWMGAGRALPAGNDCVTISILGQEGRHLGNEYLDHYRRPNPDGLSVDLPFAVPDNYSTLTIRYLGHGANSFVGNTPSEVSRFEIHQFVNGAWKKQTSGDMPRMEENLEQRYPYDDGRVLLEDGSMSTNINYFWNRGVIPLSGSLIADPAGTSTFLRVISEKDPSVGDYDDFEVCNVSITACGVGTPVIT
jgi:hypothetical protein